MGHGSLVNSVTGTGAHGKASLVRCVPSIRRKYIRILSRRDWYCTGINDAPASSSISSSLWHLRRPIVSSVFLLQDPGWTDLGDPSSSLGRLSRGLSSYNLSAGAEYSPEDRDVQSKRFLSVVLILVHEFQCRSKLLCEVLQIDHLPRVVGRQRRAS